MQRCIRQHHAEKIVLRRDLVADVCIGATAQKHNRSFARFEKRALRVGDVAKIFDCRDIVCHQRERFIHASLTLAQFSHRIVVCRIARKVKAAKTFDCNDLSFAKQATRFINRRVIRNP